MTRTTDCLKCNFPRDEPKGARVCKKCGRREDQPKGSAHRVAQTDVRAVVLDPLAEWLTPPVVEPQPDPPLYVQGVVAATAAVEKALGLSAEKGDPPTAAGAVIESVVDASSAASMVSTPSATTAEKPTVERGHSPLGGSGTKRWKNCTGSTALIQQLGLTDEETESEYSREGTQAHALAAFCLEYGTNAAEALQIDAEQGDNAEFRLLKFEDMPYLQIYLDYVRSRPGRRRYEVGFHRPELHPLYWGAIDAELIPVSGQDNLVLEIVDLKWGAGVYVPEECNEQGMYYAAGVIMEDPTFYPDNGAVRITIAQPRLTWMPEPIRTWTTTVGEIKRWLHEECLPAMNVRTQDMVLSLGDWCQFCPAKLVCRAMTENYKRFSGAAEEPLAMSDEQLGHEYSLTPYARMRIKAIEQEVLRRLMENRTVPYAQLERGKAERIWKDGAPVEGTWAGNAWEPLKLRSPAQIEKLPGGKEFVAEWAYAPEAALKAGIVGNGKKAVVLPSPEEQYGDASKYLVANKTA